MNRFVKITYGFAIALAVLSTLFQGLALYGTVIGARDVVADKPWLIPMWIGALVLVPTAVILCAIGKKKESLSLVTAILALVGALLGLAVALALKEALPIQAGNNVSINYEQGLDAWKLTYRHLSSVAAGVLVAICGFVNHSIHRAERIRLENENYVDQYELPENTTHEEPPHKLKRSMRHKAD